MNRAGTGYLLGCTDAAGVAPCVIWSRQVGANVTVQPFVPGGDPRFCVLMPRGRLQWLRAPRSRRSTRPSSARLQWTSGHAPMRWKVSSGKLPSGLEPRRFDRLDEREAQGQGHATAAVSGTDSASPPKTAKLSVPIKVT